jgi:regulator of RNase E activity RraB
MTSLGDQLKKARERLGLSQVQVFERTGINNKTIFVILRQFASVVLDMDIWKEIDQEIYCSPWEFYFDYVYPNKYQIQHIGNRKVVDSLRDSGDTLEEPRRIDHWININNLKDKKAIIKKVIDLGFEIEPKDKKSIFKKVINLGIQIVSKDKINDDSYLQIYRTDYADFHSINDITDLLVNLLEEYDAEFDGWETLALK